MKNSHRTFDRLVLNDFGSPVSSLLIFFFFLNMHQHKKKTEKKKNNCTENAPLSPFLTARRTGVRNSSLRELQVHRPVIVFSNISFNFIFISSNILVEVIPHLQKRKASFGTPVRFSSNMYAVPSQSLGTKLDRDRSHRENGWVQSCLC